MALTRNENNAKKILQLIPAMQPKARAVLRDLEGKGWEPIVVEAQRSKAQAILNALKGVGIKNSKHCVGKALDVVDARWYWKIAPDLLAKYRAHIMSSAAAHGLVSGATWTRTYGANGDWAHLEWPT
jgi:precorrin-6B methylase 1